MGCAQTAALEVVVRTLRSEELCSTHEEKYVVLKYLVGGNYNFGTEPPSPTPSPVPSQGDPLGDSPGDPLGDFPGDFLKDPLGNPLGNPRLEIPKEIPGEILEGIL